MLDIKAQEEREKAQREHDIKMTELLAKLQYQQESLNDVRAQTDRENEIKQKEKEIEDAKQNVRDAENAAKEAAAKAKASSQNPTQGPAPSTSNAAAPPRPVFPSPARDKWENQKRVDGVQNDAIDKIMGMTGLEQVKDKILRIKGSLDTMHRQGVAINKERLNLVLLGNPGTGATLRGTWRSRSLTQSSRENDGCEALRTIPRVHQGAPRERVPGDYGFQTLLRRSARRAKADR
jgi:DNA repair exonuclease SbcCD ATPase subunit